LENQSRVSIISGSGELHNETIARAIRVPRLAAVEQRDDTARVSRAASMARDRVPSMAGSD